MKKNNNLKLAIVLIIVLVTITQIVEVYVDKNFEKSSVNIIEGFLSITYIENTGGAFGIGQNDTVSFVLISLLVIGIILRFIITQKDRIDKKTLISASLILAGGVSNLIDRLVRGAVIDYIDISNLFRFPVFNLADCLICIGWIMLVISIFIYWMKSSKKAKDLERNIENEKKGTNITKDS